MDKPPNHNGLKITMGFILNLATVIVTIAIAFAYVQADLKDAQQKLQQHQIILDKNDKMLNQMQLDVKDISDNLKYFREQYERERRR